jgi:hypothetical protein
MTLSSKIKTAASLADQAKRDLGLFQHGKKKLLKTGRGYIDNHIGGVLPGDLILIGAQSGVGKTFEMIRILRGILDEDVNPNAKDIVILEYMLEMKYLNFLLRELNRITKKNKGDILTEVFTEEEKRLARDYFNSLNDGRRFVVDESVNTKEFLELTREFCNANKDKSAIVVAVDHILLVLSENEREDPLKKLAEYTNILRKEFNNVHFIFLSQLNRGIFEEVQEKSNRSMPNTGHIYGSSHFEFLCSFAIIMFNPFKLGVEQYMSFKPERYEGLNEFYGELDKSGTKFSFNTLGNMFYHVVKVRESDTPFNNLHIERMNLTAEQLEKLALDAGSNQEQNVNKIAYVPSFNNEPKVEDKPLNSDMFKEWSDLLNTKGDAPF